MFVSLQSQIHEEVVSFHTTGKSNILAVNLINRNSLKLLFFCLLSVIKVTEHTTCLYKQDVTGCVNEDSTEVKNNDIRHKKHPFLNEFPMTENNVSTLSFHQWFCDCVVLRRVAYCILLSNLFVSGSYF